MKWNFQNTIQKEANFGLFIRISEIFLAFAATVFLAKILGPREYGIYAYAYSLGSVLGAPFLTGLPTLVLRETSRGLASNSPERIKDIWLWSVKVIAIFAGIVLGTAGLFVHFHAAKPIYLLAFILVLGLSLCSLIGSALRGLHHVVVGQLPDFLIRPLLFLFFLLMAYCVFGTLSSEGAMALHIAGATASLFVGIVLLKHYVPSPTSRKFSTTAGTWIKDMFVLSLVSGLGMVNSRVDLLILGLFKDPSEVGIYRVAFQVATLSSLGLQAANRMTAPYFASSYTKGETEKFEMIARRNARYAFFFCTTSAFCFSIFGKRLLLAVFGPDYVRAYIPVLILLLGQISNSIVGSVSLILNMTGHEGETARGLIIGLTLNIVLGFLLSPYLGAKGASIAASSSMIAWNTVLLYKVKARLNVNSIAF